MAYAPPEDAERTKLTSPKLPTPKIGDIVRYYDIDGGNTQGQILVGKISLIQPILQSSPNDDGTNRWLVELTELQDVGDNYYAEYPSRKRRRSSLRKLEEVAPLAASFVRSEDAYKIPMERGTNIPLPYAVYDVANYEGPNDQPVNVDVVRADGETYNNVKLSLLKNTALAGVVGTIVAELTRGTEDALIYLAGSTAGVLYLYFLGIKTDTVGSVDAKLGSNVSNLRFVFPALVLTGVAFNNVVNNNSEVHGIFSTVTPEQFGAAMIGFLTYRVPLFVSQLFPVLFDSVSDVLPGSAGMAVRMAAEAKKRGLDVSSLDKEKEKDGLVTVLLVSGPEGTGKSTLVQRLMDEDERFVRPILQDRVADGIKFERMEQREEFLEVDKSGRYGLAKEGILQAAAKTTGDDSSTSKVVVVDADVSLAKKLVSIAEARLVGVWVGLDSLEKFESRLMAKIQSGSVTIPDGVTEEELLRIKVNQAVKDIEYGLVCGLFEFTILNDDIDESVKELKEAASYCFK
jgi:guanylate kinase